jgi:hypothetical protein
VRGSQPPYCSESKSRRGWPDYMYITLHIIVYIMYIYNVGVVILITVYMLILYNTYNTGFVPLH